MAPPEREGTCENGSLTFDRVTLPSASKGEGYEVRLRDYADPAWRGLEYRADALPPGLELTDSPPDAPILRGVATAVGSFDVVVYAVHGIDSNGCSTMPDPQPFRLEVTEGDAGADGG